MWFLSDKLYNAASKGDEGTVRELLKKTTAKGVNRTNKVRSTQQLELTFFLSVCQLVDNR